MRHQYNYNITKSKSKKKREKKSTQYSEETHNRIINERTHV